MYIEIYIEDGERQYKLSTKGDLNWEYSLENEAGECMGLSEKDLFDMLDQYFKENF